MHRLSDDDFDTIREIIREELALVGLVRGDKPEPEPTPEELERAGQEGAEAFYRILEGSSPEEKAHMLRVSKIKLAIKQAEKRGDVKEVKRLITTLPPRNRPRKKNSPKKG